MSWKSKIIAGWQSDGLNREGQKRLLLLSFAAVFFFGLAAHAYGFLRAGYSHDMLNALVVTPVETFWKMQLGRPGIVLYRRTVRGLVAAPWMLGLLSLLWLSLSCFLIGKLFRIRSPWFVILTGGILAANLSTIAMTAAYLYEMDADCFALLLGAVAVLLWDRYRRPGALFGAALTALCMSIYESMVSVPITLVMLLSMAALLRGTPFRDVFRKGLRGIAMLALGGILYWLAVRLMIAVTGISPALGNYNNPGQTADVSVLWRIGHAYRTWAWAFWNPAQSHIEPLVLVLNILLPLAALIPLLRWVFVKSTGAVESRAAGSPAAAEHVTAGSVFKPAGLPEKLLFLALLLLLPLGMNTAQLAFLMDAHDLMKFAFWLFYVLCLLPVFLEAENPRVASLAEALAPWQPSAKTPENPLPGEARDTAPSAGTLTAPTQPSRRPRLLRCVAAVLVLLLLASNIQTANVVYTRKDLEQKATLSLMTRVLTMLDTQPDYRCGETTLALVGVSDQLNRKLPGFESTYDITGCEAANPIEKSLTAYNYNTYAAYFRYVLNNPAVMADSDTWNRLHRDPRVEAMPGFPEEGCMRMIDDVFVIKMGNDTSASAALYG